MAWTKAKTSVMLGLTVLLAAGTATVVQVIQVRKHYNPDTYLSAADWRLENFRQAPPLIMVQPTRHPQPQHLLDANGNAYLNFKIDPKSGKFAGRHCGLKFVLWTAYDVPESQMVFPADAALNGYYDFLATAPNPREKLQEEIRRVTGYSAEKEMTADGEKFVVKHAN